MFKKGQSGNPNGRPIGTTNQVGDVIRADKENLPYCIAKLKKLMASKDEAIALKATEVFMKFAWSYAPQMVDIPQIGRFIVERAGSTDGK